MMRQIRPFRRRSLIMHTYLQNGDVWRWIDAAHQLNELQRRGA